MSWDALFSLVNIWALLGWVALAFLPRGPRVLSMILYAGVALLCLAYTIMLGGLLVGGWEAGLAETPDFSTLTGVMALFDAKAGAVLGWTHYLAFDLFVGLWVARDADQKGFGRVVQFPFLLLTLLVGPVGLFAWLVVRERRARALAKAT